MRRTISVEVGKGSTNHNSRKFNAKNTDPERTHLNTDFCEYGGEVEHLGRCELNTFVAVN